MDENAEIESIQIIRPNIMNVAVLPIPDDVMGEKVRAYVVSKPGHGIV